MSRNDKFNKLAGGLSPEMQKALGASWPLVAKMYDLLADQRTRLEDLRKQCDDLRKECGVIERQDDLRQMAQQRFFDNAPTNGAYHGQQALNKLLKGD
jgi:hypothetical protein